MKCLKGFWRLSKEMNRYSDNKKFVINKRKHITPEGIYPIIDFYCPHCGYYFGDTKKI